MLIGQDGASVSLAQTPTLALHSTKTQYTDIHTAHHPLCETHKATSALPDKPMLCVFVVVVWTLIHVLYVLSVAAHPDQQEADILAYYVI